MVRTPWTAAADRSRAQRPRPAGMAKRPVTALLAALLCAGTVLVVESSPAAAAVTSVRGYACGYYTNVGLFGGPQAKLGCAPQAGQPFAPATASTLSPSVELTPNGSNSPQSASDPDGAAAVYGPATISGGRWPENVAVPQPSGPINVSTQGTPAGGTVTSTATISLNPTPIPVACASGFSPPCTAPGGFGPFPVEGDSLTATCSASESSVTGSTTFSNAVLATSTDGDGNPVTFEAVPNNPPVNYTRSGVITNVGDVFTVVYNQHIVNADGSLTVNAVHMYLFGPTAVGEVVRGQVTCGTTPSPLAAVDTVAPTCGTPVVEPIGPDDPTPKSPRTELVGVFDAGLGTSGGLNQITNVQVTNGTVQIGIPSGLPYLQFLPPQRGPLQITATRTPAAEAADLPMRWSFTAIDAAGNATPCQGSVVDGVPADFDGDGKTDISVYRPSTGIWYIQNGATVPWGAAGDRAVPADYNGNHVTDIAVFRPSTGTWLVNGGASANWGGSGDIPVPANYDGDADADFAVFRPSTGVWYVQGGATTPFGTSGDVPVPGNYNGAGGDDVAVFRPSTGTWYISGGATTNFGISGDIPVPGDYDGDGDTEIAVFRPSTGTWYVSGGGATAFGTSGDVPVPGNYDGDPAMEFAVFRPSTGVWYVQGGTTTAWGASTDKALPLSEAIRSIFFP